MKYELQTIPVWKAFEAEPECVLCSLEQESEQRNVSFFLGNSIMTPEIRVKLNERGFCRRHFHLLLAGEGKLGYSLALNTHLETIEKRLNTIQRRISRAGRSAGKVIRGTAEELRHQESDCLMCDRIRFNVLNFTYTVAKLFLDEPEFAEALRGSKGFCLSHLPGLLEMGAEVIPAKRQPEWHALIFEIESNAIGRIRAHLEEFTWQFDYQTDKKTPPHARDAVQRAIERLAGYGPR